MQPCQLCFNALLSFFVPSVGCQFLSGKPLTKMWELTVNCRIAVPPKLNYHKCLASSGLQKKCKNNCTAKKLTVIMWKAVPAKYKVLLQKICAFMKLTIIYTRKVALFKISNHKCYCKNILEKYLSVTVTLGLLFCGGPGSGSFVYLLEFLNLSLFTINSEQLLLKKLFPLIMNMTETFFIIRVKWRKKMLLLFVITKKSWPQWDFRRLLKAWHVEASWSKYPWEEMRVHPPVPYTVPCNEAAVMFPSSRHSLHSVSIHMQTSVNSFYEVWILSFLSSICKSTVPSWGLAC